MVNLKKSKSLWIPLIAFCFCTLAVSQEYIADYRVSKESILRQIPVGYIEAARNNLHIMYCGTSHSSQVVDGMRGLLEYKTGDDTLFAVTFNGTPVPGALDIDYRPSVPYSAYDLSHDTVDAYGKTDYYYRTIDYLDNPVNAGVNVVMWSWCSIDGHNVQIYLDNFAALIEMYKAGGSKGRTAANEVRFVFMTGYASGSEGDTAEPPYISSPYQNHKRIVDYCTTKGYFCLDYWSQDTYEYETDFYKPTEDGNTNLQHLAYTENHTLGEDWYECRDFSSGYVQLPAHANQHLTGNRRAYGAWWIWARLAGWNGDLSGTTHSGKPDFNHDGKADILWRNYNTGGANALWLRGTATSSATRESATLMKTELPLFTMPGAIINVGKILDNENMNFSLEELRAQGIPDGFDGYEPEAVIDMNTLSFTQADQILASTVSTPLDDPDAVSLSAAAITDWILCGAGDFNNDQKPDLVWRHVGNGNNAIWFMNGTTRIGIGILPAAVNLDWRIGAIEDFNDDGNPDLIWRNISSGINAIWYMNGLNRIGVGSLPSAAILDWALCGSGDFNGDGKPDLVWRHYGNGSNAIWYMNGINRIGVGTLPSATYLDWTLCGTGDFNNDGKPDLLWRHATNGTNAIWMMNGITRIGVTTLTTVTDTSWKIEN